MTRPGRSPDIWTRGLAFPGVLGTRGLASPKEDLLSFKISPYFLTVLGESFEVDSDSWLQSLDLRVPINSYNYDYTCDMQLIRDNEDCSNSQCSVYMHTLICLSMGDSVAAVCDILEYVAAFMNFDL